MLLVVVVALDVVAIAVALVVVRRLSVRQAGKVAVVSTNKIIKLLDSLASRKASCSARERMAIA